MSCTSYVGWLLERSKVERALITGARAKGRNDDNDARGTLWVKSVVVCLLNVSLYVQAIPQELIMVFDYQELELILCGVPEIDVEDWQGHT